MNDIILVGSGGHAKSCIDVINHTGLYKVAGLVEKNIKKKINNLGFPIIGTDKDLKRLRQKFDYALITVGQINSAEIRLRLFEKLCDLDYKLPVIISPRSHISQYAEIGEGTIIMHDVILNASSKIGNTIHFDVLLTSCGNKNDASNMPRFSQKNSVKLMKRLKATNSVIKKKLKLKFKSTQKQMGTT